MTGRVGEDGRSLVRPFVEIVGYACIVLAGYVLFSVGTAWGFLAFVPALAACVYVIRDEWRRHSGRHSETAP